jgi:hypothetical protein
MTTASASLTTPDPTVDAEDILTSQLPMAVYSCSRLGRTANPPRRWFSGWFGSDRRR